MAEDKQSLPQLNLNVDPIRTPVFSVDGYLITNNDELLTLNFAQAVLGNGSQQQVVARISLTRAQAKDFVLKLEEHIEKNEI